MKAMNKLWISLSLAGLIGGCSGAEGPTRYRVSGRVSHQGQPVPSGWVYFDPDTSKDNRGPQGFAPIKNGRFDTADGGKGVVGGAHRLRVEGYDGVAVSEEAPQGKALFAPYARTVDLPAEATTIDVEVAEDQRSTAKAR
ncbi:hypothetical protein Pan216_12430 [Planctomycetes bacterium Pan216]|uniref:Carboxypeptidase regulatory-like domain-containing protein n=1 Tax=Kolteria novifilia TaxID=2527975 RepID=A0A518B0C4_9BACT|nr:hypothetical protein Pan216_12430 [Planctomycetes bacterium Pan216]